MSPSEWGKQDEGYSHFDCYEIGKEVSRQIQLAVYFFEDEEEEM